MKFAKRLLESLLEILVWLDKGVGLVTAIPFYLLIGEPKPDADETISSIVGRHSVYGNGWAQFLEWFIDRLFYVFENCELGHCRKSCGIENIDIEYFGDNYLPHYYKK